MTIATIDDEQVQVEDIEIQLLLEAIYLKYGYDFRQYSKSSIKRRIQHRQLMADIPSLAIMQQQILRDRQLFLDLLADLTINVTEMFRDPTFYAAFKRQVIPLLETHPFVKIWHAGCSTGEEVYSMAIMLQEAGLSERCRIYATDIDQGVLQQAKKGIFPLANLTQYSENYRLSGGLRRLEDYYTARYDHVLLDHKLRKNIVFADHDLVTDQVFGEMHVIICRNVMIYFDKELQKRVFQLFADSLDLAGVLCLGSKETLRHSGLEQQFRTLDKDQRIFQKTGH